MCQRCWSRWALLPRSRHPKALVAELHWICVTFYIIGSGPPPSVWQIPCLPRRLGTVCQSSWEICVFLHFSSVCALACACGALNPSTTKSYSGFVENGPLAKSMICHSFCGATPPNKSSSLSYGRDFENKTCIIHMFSILMFVLNRSWVGDSRDPACAVCCRLLCF